MTDRILTEQEVTDFMECAGGSKPWIAIKLLCISHRLLKRRVKQLEQEIGALLR